MNAARHHRQAATGPKRLEPAHLGRLLHRKQSRTAQLAAAAPPAGSAEVATLENVLLALLPRVVMAAMHTTIIRASMTAYSTAVGPSSFFRNSTTFLVTCRMTSSEVVFRAHTTS